MLVVVEADAFPWLLLAVSESLLCEAKSPSSWLETKSSKWFDTTAVTTEDCEYLDAIKSPNAIQKSTTPSQQPSPINCPNRKTILTLINTPITNPRFFIYESRRSKEIKKKKKKKLINKAAEPAAHGDSSEESERIQLGKTKRSRE
jgi:hypothetical protein